MTHAGGGAADRRRPWLPACVAVHGFGTDDVGELSYIVVEEIVEDIADLTVSSWPAADGNGRLRFEGEVDDVAVRLRQLHDEIYEGWLPRHPRIGDVFGARVHRDALRAAEGFVWEGPLARLFPGPLYDLTQEARLVAKLAMYAVRSDIIPMAKAEAFGMADDAVHDRRRAAVRGHLGAELDEEPT